MDCSVKGESREAASFNEEQEQEEQVCSHALQLVNSSVVCMVMQAAVELQVLEIIAKAGVGAQLSPSEIASQIPCTQLHNPQAPAMLDRMLRLLASHSILTSTSTSSVESQRLYGLAPVAKYFVRNQDGVSLGPVMSLVQGKAYMDSWYELKTTIVEGGIPFNRAHGVQLFEYPSKDLRFNEVFNKAMINHTTIVIKKILQSYKGFNQLTRLVDVGGGLGVTLNLITSKYPHIKGINFDLPHVIQHAPPYSGVEHVVGDMFESVPKGDAIFMKWILHDWSDDYCLKLLKNCHKAIPENGKVIVVEAILPETPDTSVAAKSNFQMDLLMMTETPGGKERTQQEFLALANEAGFAGIILECFACNSWVMEFYK
ncbi:nicotinamide N-methyltransferase [Sarracenia purpurea var. burkii]